MLPREVLYSNSFLAYQSSLKTCDNYQHALNLNHLMLLVSFYTHWKYKKSEVFWCCHEMPRETNGMKWLTDDSDKTFTHCGQVAVIVVQFILSNYWKKIIWQIHANFGASCSIKPLDIDFSTYLRFSGLWLNPLYNIFTRD